MRLTKAFILIFISLCTWSPVHAQPADRALVAVPAAASEKKARLFNNVRLRLIQEHDTLLFQVAGIPKLSLPFQKVRVRYSRGGKTTGAAVFRKQAVLNSVNYDRIAALERIRNYYIGGDPLFFQRYDNAHKKFVGGKNGGEMMKTTWHTLLRTRLPDSGEELKVTMRSGFLKKAVLSADTLPTVFPHALPVLDEARCVPFDRFFERKKLAGWGLDNVRYFTYSHSSSKTVRASFDVYFEKNKADLAPGQVQPVIDYLTANNYSIRQLTIEAYSSIEGDSLLNQRLHRRRADRLLQLFNRYNDEPIASDTLFFSEAWLEFRAALKNTSFRYLDTLSNAEIRELVNRDQQLLQQIEPLLVPLRRGKISLAVSRKYTTAELLANARTDYHDYCRKWLAPSGQSKAAAEQKMFGVIRYLDRMIRSGKATYEDLEEMIDSSPAPHYGRILLFFHMVRCEEQGQAPEVRWDSLFQTRSARNIFYNAFAATVDLIETPGLAHLQQQFLRQANDIQYYTTRYIEEQRLYPEILCEISYPDRRIFYGLILNHYAMVFHMDSRFVLPCYTMKRSAVLSEREPEFTEAAFDEFMASVPDEPVASIPLQTPTFDNTMKSDYYFFIKKLFASRDKTIRNYASMSDNLAEFDLLYLLQVNVTNWDPLRNRFYDNEINRSTMAELISMLEKMGGRICTPTVSRLFLDFHLKNLQYLQRYSVPGSTEEVSSAGLSVKFIGDYYRKYEYRIFPRFSLYLVDGINSFHTLPTRTPAYKTAAALLEDVKSMRPLVREEEFRLVLMKALINDQKLARKNKKAGRRQNTYVPK